MGKHRVSLFKSVACLGFGIMVALGSGLCAQEPVDPGTDAEVRALLAAAGTATDNPGAGSVIVLDRTRVQVEKSGLGHINKHYLVKVLTDKGALKYTRLRFDYDPQSNVVNVKSVRIFRAGGAVKEVPLQTMVDLPQPQRGIFWGPRMKLVPLPRLLPGDAIEYRYYTKGFIIAYLRDQDNPGGTDEDRFIPPMRGHYYDIVAFGAPEPIHRKHYTVETLREVPLQYEVCNGPVHAMARVTDKANIYSFWRERIPAFRPEPRAARLNDQVAKVVMATVPDWKEKSRWFYKVNEPQFKADDAIKAKVAELLEGKENDRDRIAALVHWCANEIRYAGINMGKGEGYTLHPSTMTFQDRCGVCKDKAGIAVTMLRVAGYTVYPALTMAGERVENIPADQFNHCVLAVRMDDRVKEKPAPSTGVFLDGGRWWLLDPTWVVFSPELWSSAESEQHVVIGSPEGEDLMVTPLRPASHNRIVIEGTSALKPGGLVEGAFTVTGAHYADQRLRRFLVHAGAPDRRSRFEKWVGNISLEGEVVSFTDDYAALQDVTRPVPLTIKYRLPETWLAVGKQIRFSPPLSSHPVREQGIVPYWGRAGSATRSQPLCLWATREVVLRERIALPAGYKVKRVPKAVKISNPAASLHADWRQEGDGLVFEATVSSLMRTVPPEQYPGFKEVVDAVMTLAAKEIVLER